MSETRATEIRSERLNRVVGTAALVLLCAVAFGMVWVARDDRLAASTFACLGVGYSVHTVLLYRYSVKRSQWLRDGAK